MDVLIDGVRYVPAPPVCDNPALLDVVFHCADIGRDVSVREYLCELLSALWEEGEGFSGKRPFGNSGWEFDLYRAMVVGKAVDGSVDADGCVDINTKNRREADPIVFGLIAEMCGVTR